jgi:hypothetical protein
VHIGEDDETEDDEEAAASKAVEASKASKAALERIQGVRLDMKRSEEKKNRAAQVGSLAQRLAIGDRHKPAGSLQAPALIPMQLSWQLQLRSGAALSAACDSLAVRLEAETADRRLLSALARGAGGGRPFRRRRRAAPRARPFVCECCPRSRRPPRQVVKGARLGV